MIIQSKQQIQLLKSILAPFIIRCCCHHYCVAMWQIFVSPLIDRLRVWAVFYRIWIASLSCKEESIAYSPLELLTSLLRYDIMTLANLNVSSFELALPNLGISSYGWASFINVSLDFKTFSYLQLWIDYDHMIWTEDRPCEKSMEFFLKKSVTWYYHSLYE